MGVAGADGMGRGLHGMGHSLGAAHPLRPSGRSAGNGDTGGRGAVAGGITADRAHGGRAARRLERGLATGVEAGAHALGGAGGSAAQWRDRGAAARTGDPTKSRDHTRRAGLPSRAKAVSSRSTACDRSTATGGGGCATGERRAARRGCTDRADACRHHAACGEACADGCACAELGAARDDAACDTGTEDAEAEQRQRGEHDSHGFVDRRVLPVPEQPASKLALTLDRSVAYLGAADIQRRPLLPLPYFRSPFLNRGGAGVVPSATRWSSHSTGGLISNALRRTPSGRASSRIAATMSGASRVRLRCLAT